MSEKTFLIGDIGGTNARFALANPAEKQFDAVETLKCADFPNIQQAIRHFLGCGGYASPTDICLAVAGPIKNRNVSMTNNDWQIDSNTLSQGFAGANIKLINDFAAIAYAVPFLDSHHYLTIGPAVSGQQGAANAKFGIIGPGTGLGAAGLIVRDGQLIQLASEAGHTGFAPLTPLQSGLLMTLCERYPRVSNERLLSGSGIENIHKALSRMREEPYTKLTAAGIFRESGEKPKSIAGQSVDLFFEILGQVAGDLALTLGAEDGIYIAGGITKRYPEQLKKSRFREAFENKGRYRSYMQQIPTRQITHPHPGLLGACVYLSEKL